MRTKETPPDKATTEPMYHIVYHSSKSRLGRKYEMLVPLESFTRTQRALALSGYCICLVIRKDVRL